MRANLKRLGVAGLLIFGTVLAGASAQAQSFRPPNGNPGPFPPPVSSGHDGSGYGHGGYSNGGYGHGGWGHGGYGHGGYGHGSGGRRR